MIIVELYLWTLPVIGLGVRLSISFRKRSKSPGENVVPPIPSGPMPEIVYLNESPSREM